MIGVPSHANGSHDDDCPTGAAQVHDFVTLPQHDVLVASFAHWRPLAVVSCLNGAVVAWLNGSPWPAAHLTFVPSLSHVVAVGRGKQGMHVWDARGAVHYARQVSMQTTPPFCADVRTVAAGQPVDAVTDASRRVGWASFCCVYARGSARRVCGGGGLMTLAVVASVPWHGCTPPPARALPTPPSSASLSFFNATTNALPPPPRPSTRPRCRHHW